MWFLYIPLVVGVLGAALLRLVLRRRLPASLGRSAS